MKKGKKSTNINSPWREVWRRFKKNRPAMIGLALFTLILLITIFADVIVPAEMTTATDARSRLLGPSWEHPFGTDQLGRDVFARVIHGSRPSLLIGLVATIIAALVGVLLGGVVGYYGGAVDYAIMRIMEVIQCIPTILLLLVIISALGTGMGNLLIAMMVSAVPGTVRMVRAVILNFSDAEYIQSAKSYGMSELAIIVKHLLPNAMGQIIIHTAGLLSGIILSVASMSFLGFGVQAPMAEWGIMVAESRDFMRTSAYLTIFPGMAIVLSALSINLIGDGLRDALDPRLKD